MPINFKPLSLAQANLVLAGSEVEIQEAVMDKGYHDNRLLAELAQRGLEKAWRLARERLHSCFRCCITGRRNIPEVAFIPTFALLVGLRILQ
jgi:hypothetical protein